MPLSTSHLIRISANRLPVTVTDAPQGRRQLGISPLIRIWGELGAVGYWVGIDDNAHAYSDLVVTIPPDGMLIYGWLYDYVIGESDAAVMVQWTGGVGAWNGYAKEGVGSGFVVGSGNVSPAPDDASAVRAIWAIVCDQIGGVP